MTQPRKPGQTEALIGVGVVVIVVAAIAVWVLVPSLHPRSSVPGTAVAGATTSRTTSIPSSIPSPSAAGTGSCKYTRTSAPARDVGLPQAQPKGTSGTVRITLKTNQGDIPLTLDRGEAPCTVNSFEFLAGKKYFEGTPCHRLTAASSLSVLQCGDPSGSGSGGPGYQFADELPQGLKKSDDGAAVYPAGTVAMANAGPGTNGSQFFLVYADSTIPPSYSVFGTFDSAGMAVLQKIAAGGDDDSNGPGDGAPKTPVTIQQVVAEG